MTEDLDHNEAQLMQALALQDDAVSKDFKAYAGEPNKPTDEKIASKEDIIEALKTVCDPEIMINVYDMGLIYDIRQKDNGDVEIDMTLTAPTCPVAGVLPQEVADAIALVEGVGKVEVKVVWEPAWSLDKISDDARAMIDLL